MASSKTPSSSSTSAFSQFMLELDEKAKSEGSSAAPAKDPRSELTELVRARAEMAERVAAMEHEIYNAEGDYLRSTDLPGNVIQGWNFSQASQSPSLVKGMKRKASRNLEVESPQQKQNQHDKNEKKFRDSDRLFSRSSVVTMESLAKCVEAPKKAKCVKPRTRTTSASKVCADHYLVDHSYAAPCSSYQHHGSDDHAVAGYPEHDETSSNDCS